MGAVDKTVVAAEVNYIECKRSFHRILRNESSRLRWPSSRRYMPRQFFNTGCGKVPTCKMLFQWATDAWFIPTLAHGKVPL